MSVNVYTEWGKLKEIVVGTVVDLLADSARDSVDLSFKLFYHQNIKDQILKNSVDLQKRLIEQRQEDLDALARYLEKQDIRVHRPQKLPDLAEFKTPVFTARPRPMDNPRDLILIVGDMIIETPVLNRARFFETDLLKPTLQRYFLGGARWICAPRPTLQEKAFDFSFVKSDPGRQDFSMYENHPEAFEIMFDAAQVLKLGRHLLMNVSTENHRLGAKWLQGAVGESFKVVTVEVTDHHIDGMIMPLRPGKMLISPAMKAKLHLLPKPLQKWDAIEFDDPENTAYDDDSLLLASANISANVLSLDPENVLVFSPTGKPPLSLTRNLEKHGFNAHVVQLRHSRVFDGGLHCATLDTVRQDRLEDFFAGELG